MGSREGWCENSSLKVLSKELGIPAEVNDSVVGNDHVPFVCAGIPAITVNREGGLPSTCTRRMIPWI